MANIVTPILDSGLMESVNNAIVQYQHRGLWKELGMDRLRHQGTALLFYGPSGTGKTTTARWIAHLLKMEFRSVDYSEIGSDKPGQLSRNIKAIFASSKKEPNLEAKEVMLFFDECDTMLINRQKLGYDSMWMLEPINQLLVSIRQWQGLLILATNAKIDFLDPAIQTRLQTSLYFGPPQEELTSVNLWKQKWPKRLPLELTDEIIDSLELGKRHLTGAQIENVLIEWVSDAIRGCAKREDVNLNVKILRLLIDYEEQDYHIERLKSNDERRAKEVY